MDPIKTSSPLRILLVEDNEHDRLFFRRALRKSQVASEITECIRAEEALKRLRTSVSSFDIVVVDHALPGMSGLDLCKELLDEEAPLPMVILTGKGSEQLAVDALKAGVDDYMIKDPAQSYLDLLPVVLPQVVLKHEDRIARKRAEEALQKAHDELEQRVEERTAELARTTDQLKLELTERERAEAALKESEQCFKNLSENAPDIIFTLGLDGALTYLNPAFEKILGYSRKEGLGKYFASFAMQVDTKNYMNLFKRVRDGKETIRDLPIILIHKDRSARLLNLSGAPNINGEGEVTGMVGLLKDITQHRKLETQFHQAQKMEVLGTLSGGIAHDFNNLLMGIDGNTTLMLLDLDSSHPHYEGLRRIKEQIQRGVRLTRRLIGYASKGKSEFKPIDLNQLVEDTSETFGRIRKEITIHLQLGKDLFAIEADEVHIEQVLLNLFINAADAMPDGGDLTLKTMNTTQNEIKSKRFDPKPGNYVLLMVTDTGAGMDKETMERIFDPLFTTKKMGLGTGLGLTSAYTMIREHGGYIDVESIKGYSTTFTIYLPAIEKKPQKAVKTPGEIVKGTGTVLLVDDEEAALEVGKGLLEAIGYRVLIAKDGKEAIDVYRKSQNDIDIVLLNMVMPNMGGLKAYDRMKEISPDIKVILSSGYGIDGQASEILNRGCDGFIQKPFTMRELSIKIREALEKK